MSFDYNCYYGVDAVGEDAHKKTSDPLFADPGKGLSGDTAGWAAGSLDGYKLNSLSPCVNAGARIADNGGIDFWSGTLYKIDPE